MIKKIRVIVIDDSAFMRKVISDIINEDYRCEVVAVAKDGKDGLNKIKEYKPDVVTLDVQMPEMNGFEMLKHCDKKNPIPVIMLSSLTSEGAKDTIKALEYGAVDFVTKPKNIFSVNSDEIKKELVDKIVVASKIPLHKIVVDEKVITSYNKKIVINKDIDNKDDEVNNIITIGTSTGGPKALQKVIPKLPADINGGVVIVQHMPPGFTKSLANRLNTLSNIIVKEAEDGDILKKGVAYIAPGDKHLELRRIVKNKYRIVLTSNDPVRGHRPSVDVMFNSISKVAKCNVVGVVMTGMGADGSEGAVNLKRHNSAYIIAQDEKSCVVYGMPKAVVEKGVTDEVVSIDMISKTILKRLG